MLCRHFGATHKLPAVRSIAGLRTFAFLVAILAGPMAQASLSGSPTPNTTGNYTVSWSPVSDAQWYVLQESTDGGSTWPGYYEVSLPMTSKSFVGKATGTYTYKLKSCKEFYRFGEWVTTCLGNETTSVVVNATPPSVPTGLTGPTTDYNGAWSMSWNAAAGAAKYRLQEKVGSGSWSQINYTAATSHPISGKSAGSYSYRVQACNSASECSGWSTTHTVTVAAPPVTPTGLTGPTTDYNGAYTISWNASSGSTSYRLEERLGSGSWTQVYSGGLTSKAVSGNSAGSWSYRVRGCNVESVCSSWSTTQTVTVAAPPVTPTGLTGPTTDYNGSYTISWNASSRSSSYRLQERLGSGSWAQIYSGASISKAVSGKSAGSWSYRVRGCNAESVCSSWSSLHTTTVAAPPAIPSGLTGPSSSADGDYTISWNSSSGSSSYRLEEKLDSGVWTQIHSGAATSKARFGQSPGLYTYRVRGCNVESVCSGWSSTHAVEVPVPPPPVNTWLPADDGDFSDGAVVSPYVPSGDTGMNSVGAVQGSGGVSGGSASYQIPIAVPPGRRGVQPHVSLSYSSSSGNGVAGVGWSLNAGSAITRCAATPAQDQFSAAVQYDALRDRLCLDGRRLVVVSGVYGQSGAQYRVELDVFARITQNGSLNGTTTNFQVEFKDGRISKYGTTAGSRHSASGRSEILTWAIRETQDRSGNTITYDYQSFGNGEYHLDAIHYTGVNGSDGDRHVRFDYEDRGDYRTSYLAGGKTRSTQRLKSVRTEYQATPIREYTLSYGGSLSTARSLLRSIQECAYLAGQAHCLRPTTFEWQEHAPQYVAERLQFHNGAGWEVKLADKRWLHEVVPHGDRNGDGVKDWPDWFANAEGQIVSGTGNGISNCYKKQNSFALTCLEVDFDADGLTDSFRRYNNKLQVKQNISASWINTGIDWVPSSFPTMADTPLGFADFNGDGWVDLAMKHGGKLWIYRHTKTVSAPYSTGNRHLIFTYSQNTQGTAHLQDLQIYGDMDGNGIPDFVSSNTTSNRAPGLPRPTSIYLMHSNANGAITTTTRGIGELGVPVHVNATWFHDVNGDGLADLLRIDPANEGSGGVVQYRLNNGTDFISGWLNLSMTLPMREPGVYEFGPGENETYNEPAMSKVMAMDYDGDGRQEILVAGTVLASSCSQVQPVGYKCDNQLYGNYHESFYANVGTPMNSAIEDDSVRRYSARRFTEDSTGNIVTTSFSTDIIGSASQTAVIDASGDGLPDVVTVLGCRFATCGFNADSVAWGGTVTNPTYVAGAWINRNMGAATGLPTIGNAFNYEPYDLMNAVENGFDIRHEWTYKPLSSDEYNATNSDFYETTHDYFSGTYDYFHFASSMYVVADHRASNGIGGLNSTKYRYRGAVYNNKGRGFQGFRSIIAEEDVYASGHPLANTDKITRTDFHQTWPLSSIVDQSCTWLATTYVVDDNPNCQNVISHTTVDEIHNETTAGSADFVAIKAQTDRVYDLNSGTLLTTGIMNRDFDSWGNVTQETRSHIDAYTTNSTETTQIFIPDPTSWWLDKLDSRIVTHYPVSLRPFGPAIAPGTDGMKQVTTAFQYNPTHRLPSSVAIAANDTPLTQTVTTLYNDRGLPTSITTVGTNVTGPRTTTMTYSDNGTIVSGTGYFPFSITNTLGHQAKRETDPTHGQPTKLIDPNGLVSTTDYDAFGRVSQTTPAGQPTQHVRYFWCGITPCPSDAIYAVGTYSAGAPETHTYLDQVGRERQSSVRNFADSSFVNVRTEYDERGNKTFESQPYDPLAGESDQIGTRYLSYDALGRLMAREQDQANGVPFLTSYSYQGLKTSINAGGLMMHRVYNGLEQLVETRDAKGEYTRYAYDGAGNPIVLQDPNGHSITASFNALGHKVWVKDPNMGEKEFSYSAFGEVLQDKDINCSTSVGCDTVAMDYDVLGRLIERRANGVPDGAWGYDNAAADKGIGLLDFEDSGNSSGSGLRKSYFYSNASTNRKALTRTVHGFYQGSPSSGTDFETRYYTDSYYGRPKGIRYPGGVGVAFLYNAGGYLVQEKDASSSYTIRQINARDSRNQVIQSSLANGTLTHTAEYYDASGQMKAIVVSGTGGQLHKLDYDYDTFGNLEYQSTDYGGAVSTEIFYYDDLHRLMQSSRSLPGGSAIVNYDYDASGNLTLKDDYASSYTYLPGRPNAVASITKVGGGTVNFTYDANGNMKTGDGKSIAYNAHNLPTGITAGGITAGFSYGADLTRFRQDRGSGKITLYVDKHMEVVQVGSSADYRHYLGDAAILTKTGDLTDPTPAVRFLHRDRLGSVVTITDENGEEEARGYDPFGKPRDGDWANRTPPVIGSAITDRGFTDHEHLDESQLIHMNGRVYDYNLGRFLSVDPFIQAPGNSQSMNPYSYIMNNPLSGTDPSGYAAIDDECQAKPAGCRAVMAAESGGMNSGLIGNFGMPSYRGELLAGSNGASVGHVSPLRTGRVTIEDLGGDSADEITPSQDETGQGSSSSVNYAEWRIQQPDFLPAYLDYLSARDALIGRRGSYEEMLDSPFADHDFATGITIAINRMNSQIAAADRAFDCKYFDCGIESVAPELYLGGVGGAARSLIGRAVAARAAPTLSAFTQGGKTVGVLRTASGNVPLQSGWAGPASSVPRGTSGFDIVTRTHVEGHAAAAMRQGGISEATLYINNPTICTSCARLLPRMLPPGGRLTVITPNGSTTFVGIAP